MITGWIILSLFVQISWQQFMINSPWNMYKNPASGVNPPWNMFKDPPPGASPPWGAFKTPAPGSKGDETTLKPQETTTEDESLIEYILLSVENIRDAMRTGENEKIPKLEPWRFMNSKFEME